MVLLMKLGGGKLHVTAKQQDVSSFSARRLTMGSGVLWKAAECTAALSTVDATIRERDNSEWSLHFTSISV